MRAAALEGAHLHARNLRFQGLIVHHLRQIEGLTSSVFHHHWSFRFGGGGGGGEVGVGVLQQSVGAAQSDPYGSSSLSPLARAP